ncbi:ribonuclease HI family protein [Desulfobulbus sp.]|uniref:ribonuclease HI family protein n=1 Tax=Desulfobulbus sp. TaxID=895 RepID=UPI00286EEF5B|nr:ribonuclease HI family protein [Desulfobulbus sp.]
MDSELPAREHILRQLADHLDDDTFRRIFPDQHPDAIRGLLLGRQPTAAVNRATAAPTVRSTPAGKATTACRLFTDGASRGNPGQAGAGAVLLGERGEELAACSVYLGTCTNNVAEYKALLVGLEEAQRKGCGQLAIFLDSELIVRQVQGRYKVKNETLLPLFRQVRERLDRFETWSIAHVPRAQNARADQLANQGIDRRHG